jgi:hypothetical protein
VIEVNARLGGDLIPYLGMRTTGIDPGLAAAAVAVGRRPDVSSDRKLLGAVAFSYVERPMTIAEIGFDQQRLPAEIDQAVVRAEPGQRHSPPPAGTVWGRIAYTTVLAETEQACRHAIEVARSALRVTAAAEPEPSAGTRPSAETRP